MEEQTQERTNKIGVNPFLTYTFNNDNVKECNKIIKNNTGFIRVREMSGKFKIFQGQGIVGEFHNLSDREN